MATIPQLKLISHKLCPYVQRSIITLLEKQIPHQREYIDLAHKPDWFLQISPLGKVPLLLVEAEVLFESAVICEYLDEITPGSLHPTDALEKAKHRAWIEFGSNILVKIAGFYSAPDKASLMAKQQELTDAFQLLEQNLSRSPYFNGESFSLIDAVYGPIFRYFGVFEQYQDFGFFSHTPRVKAWQDALLQRPSVQQAVSGDYPILLKQFLERKDSYLSRLI
jgi:glutathione S-transferase